MQICLPCLPAGRRQAGTRWVLRGVTVKRRPLADWVALWLRASSKVFAALGS